MLIVATSLAGRSGTFLPLWLARAGLGLTPVMIVAGVVGLLPPLMFALLGLWLMGVAFSLMFRPVVAAAAGSGSAVEPTAAPR